MLADIGHGRAGHISEVHLGPRGDARTVDTVDQVDHRHLVAVQQGDLVAESLGADGGDHIGVGGELDAAGQLRALHVRVLVAAGFVYPQLHALAPRLLIQAPGHAPPVAVHAMGQEGADAPGPAPPFQRPVAGVAAVHLHPQREPVGGEAGSGHQPAQQQETGSPHAVNPIRWGNSSAANSGKPSSRTPGRMPADDTSNSGRVARRVNGALDECTGHHAPSC
ncbi:hypothetical protein D3C84_670140 [compost metagenome]